MSQLKLLKNKKAEQKNVQLLLVGVAGFEPATSASQTRRDNRATLHPEMVIYELEKIIKDITLKIRIAKIVFLYKKSVYFNFFLKIKKNEN